MRRQSTQKNKGFSTDILVADIKMTHNEYINFLTYGIKINIYRKITKTLTSSVLYLDEGDDLVLRWFENMKNYTSTIIKIFEIKRIESHSKTKIPQKIQKQYNKIMAIHTDSNKEFLLLFKNDDNTREKIIYSLKEHLLFRKNEVEKLKDVQHNFLVSLYSKADKDGNKGLTVGEVEKLLESIHFKFNKKKVEQIFNEFDHNQNNAIDFNEFKLLIEKIYSKNELKPVIRNFLNLTDLPEDYDDLMTKFDLMKFFESVQEQKLSQEEVDSIFGENNYISFIEFSYILFSHINISSAIDIYKQDNVYQDMSHPINEYYICSSHNTYLIGNQLSGESSVEGYKRALELGVRVFEIDTWNGPNDLPVVTHGNTLVNKILFSDVIQAFRNYGFETNPYPIIITIENHCNHLQQKKMTEILEKILASTLYMLPNGFKDFKQLPSPSQLKHKILIRSGGDYFLRECINDFSVLHPDLSSVNIENILLQMEDDYCEHLYSKTKNIEKSSQIYNKTLRVFLPNANQSEILSFESEKTLNNMHKGFDEKEHHSSSGLIENRPNFQHQNSDKLKILASVDKEEKLNKNFENNASDGIIENSEKTEKTESYANGTPNRNSVNKNMPQSDLRNSVNKNMPQSDLRNSVGSPSKKKVKLDLSLNNILSLFGYSYHDNIYHKIIWNVSSFSEKKFLKLCKNEPEKLGEYCKENLIRIFPKGMRIDSSNFDPVQFYNVGAQLVCLNVQTYDLNSIIMFGKFADNGGCGYLLKPLALRLNGPQSNTKASSKPVKYKFELISGQQLGDLRKETSFDIIDPYVVMYVRGHQKDEDNNKKWESPFIKDNGFHPIWTEKNVFEFTLQHPEYDMLIIQVKDKNVQTDEEVGRYCIPFSMLRVGYRTVPLFRKNEMSLAEHVCLFFKISKH